MASSLCDTEEITALVGLLNDATRALITSYNDAGDNGPRLSAAEAGPFDNYQKASSVTLNAIQVIRGACAQLSAVVSTPGQYLLEKGFAFQEPACLRVVVTAKVSDVLVECPEGLEIQELARRCGAHPQKLHRIMKFLVTKHIYNEVKPGYFTNNRHSLKLKSTEPLASFILHLSDESLKCHAVLTETLLDPELGHSFETDKAPFTVVNKKVLFDFYKEDPVIGPRFNKGLEGLAEGTGKSMISRVYPWGEIAPGSTICDIGGGKGHLMLDVLRNFPKMKAVLQDLPNVLVDGEQLWKRELPSSLDDGRIKFVPINFFEDSPVKGCDFYFLANVLHDWEDDSVTKILNQVRKSAVPGNKLMIYELVLKDTVRSTGKCLYDEAPEPLLPNYGAGGALPYCMDLQMLALLNAKERPFGEYVSLSERSGFKFVKLWDSGEYSLLEFDVV